MNEVTLGRSFDWVFTVGPDAEVVVTLLSALPKVVSTENRPPIERFGTMK